MRSDMQAIYVMWLRQVKRFIRAKSRLVGNLFQPLLFLAAFGFGFRGARFTGIPTTVSYLEFLAPGMVVMSVIFSSMFAGISVLWDRQFGFLKEVLVAPVRRISIVIGKTLGGSTIALIQGFIILAASVAMGVRVSALGVVACIFLMILVAFSSVGFGLAFASRMEDVHGFSLIMNLLIMPAMFLSTAFFPLQGIPEAFKLVIYANPVTYEVDAVRQVLIGVGYIPLWADILVTLGVTCLTIFAGAYLFSKCEA